MTPLASAWTHRYADLGDTFATPLRPTPLAAPAMVAVSESMAAELGWSVSELNSETATQVLAGNEIWPGNRPWAGVYSGHQFGQWAGQLGDGRAITLGEWPSSSGPQEIQLKGAGPTPYSRRGDGRAVWRSAIREFLASEAMHALGVPTTRALCLVASPEPVRREAWEAAAVVTRVAPSFIRFGHFEHFAHTGQHDALRQLADFVIEHFYPECRAADGNPYAALLAAVTERTADLMAHWQVLGFCHGVMNTDNMSILGLTIDYGPFQFMDEHDPGHICNHSDHQGRYAFDQQVPVANWNLFCLGQALLPLMDSTEPALAALAPYATRQAHTEQRLMTQKLGWQGQDDGDAAAINDLRALMAQHRVDHTAFFWRLADALRSDSQAVRDLFVQPQAWDAWAHGWRERAQRHGQTLDTAYAQMRRHNPAVVLRNHLGQQAIERAERGDWSEVHRLQKALATPFEVLPGCEDLVDVAPDWASTIAISCSS
jgi:serine/tyrosine/threonine adenylyltransferase